MLLRALREVEATREAMERRVRLWTVDGYARSWIS